MQMRKIIKTLMLTLKYLILTEKLLTQDEMKDFENLGFIAKK